MKYASEKRIDLYLPVPRTGHVPDERFYQDSFVYDDSTDSYTCPAGARLSYVRSRRRRGKQIRVYSGSASICGGCRMRQSCTRARVRRLEVSEHYRYEQEMKAKLATEHGRSTYDRRDIMVDQKRATLLGSD